MVGHHSHTARLTFQTLTRVLTQYHVYLFETILLCCKDIDLSKPKNKLSNKQLVDKRGKPKLQLKGRIFMQNVTDLLSLSKPGMTTTTLSVRSSERVRSFCVTPADRSPSL